MTESFDVSFLLPSIAIISNYGVFITKDSNGKVITIVSRIMLFHSLTEVMHNGGASQKPFIQRLFKFPVERCVDIAICLLIFSKYNAFLSGECENFTANKNNSTCR